MNISLVDYQNLGQKGNCFFGDVPQSATLYFLRWFPKVLRFRVKGSVSRCAILCSLIKSIRKNKEKHPAWTIHFFTLTNTDMRVAKEKLTDADNIFFVPLDFKHVVRKYFNTLRPRVFVLAESELWPNLLRKANRQTKGVLLINGRISSRSFKGYSRFKFVAKKILKNIDLFLVQTEKDKENLLLMLSRKSILKSRSTWP